MIIDGENDDVSDEDIDEKVELIDAPAELEAVVEDPPAEAEEETVLKIAGEEPKEEGDPNNWVNELRKSNRELKKEKRALEEQLKASATAKQNIIDPGKKPTLEQFEFDTDKFEEQYAIWSERKRAAEDAERKIQEERHREQEEWNRKLSSYEELKKKLPFKDIDESEDLVKGSLSDIQRGLIIECSDNPALVVYALGKNIGRLREIGSITNAAKFASKIGIFEKDLTMEKRAKPPAPEKMVRGSGRTSGVVSNALEKLRSDAAMSGDLTQVLKYKLEQRAKGKR
jgi:hypothetical protein